MAPISITTETGGGVHRLTFDDGAVNLDDHPHQDAEAVLRVFGSGCRCHELARAWTEATTDLDVLLLGPRRLGEPPVISVDGADGLRSSFVQNNRTSALGWRRAVPAFAARIDGLEPEINAFFDRFVLLNAAPALVHELVRLVLAWAEEQWPDDAFRRMNRARLHVALVSRAQPIVNAWAGDGRAIVSLEDGDAPTVSARGDELQIGLPLRWLREVWCEDRVIVEDRFVIDVRNEAVSIDRGGNVDLAPREVTEP